MTENRGGLSCTTRSAGADGNAGLARAYLLTYRGPNVYRDPPWRSDQEFALVGMKMGLHMWDWAAGWGTKSTRTLWTKGMTVCNFEKMGGMRHFGGTASEQVDFRHTVAMKLNHQKFCDLIVDALERLTKQKG